MAGGRRTRTDLASAAWGQIARLFLSQQHRRAEIAASFGLQPSDLMSLFHIQPGAGMAQRDLATDWACDPSWVTNRIDRLERAGLVERRPAPDDRRVKMVWLTDDGYRTRSSALDAFAEPPAVLTELGTADLEQLARVLGKLDLPDPTLMRDDRAAGLMTARTGTVSRR